MTVTAGTHSPATGDAGRRVAPRTCVGAHAAAAAVLAACVWVSTGAAAADVDVDAQGVAASSATTTSTTRWAVMLDAGSSGTRVYVCAWDAADPLSTLRQLGRLRTNPGLSSLVDGSAGPPAQVSAEQLAVDVDASLQPLLAFATDTISAATGVARLNETIAATPVFLRATAGLRLLPPAEQDRITTAAGQVLVASPFRCDEHTVNDAVRVVSGVEEGLNLFMSANAALGAMASAAEDAASGGGGGSGSWATASRRLFGVFDMGGASAQIAFVPAHADADADGTDDALARSDILAVSIARTGGATHGHPSSERGAQFPLYSASRLRYGLLRSFNDFMRSSYARFVSRGGAATKATSPCLFGDQRHRDPSGFRVRGRPSGGDFDMCVGRVRAWVAEREADPGLNNHVPPQPPLPLGSGDAASAAAAAASSQLAEVEAFVIGSAAPTPPSASEAAVSGPQFVASDNFWKVASRLLYLDALRRAREAAGDGGVDTDALPLREEQPYLVTTADAVAEAARHVCVLPYPQVVADLPESKSLLRARLCFGAAYVVAMLETYGYPTSRPLHVAKDLPLPSASGGEGDGDGDSTFELNWPMGAVVREILVGGGGDGDAPRPLVAVEGVAPLAASERDADMFARQQESGPG